MKIMRGNLINLLNIHGVSGDEKKVRRYLVPILDKYMDKVFTDNYGNLLAEKKVGDGKGATVLLSAHMDTVKGVLKDRKLLIDGDIIKSNKGALGADDRAGIAIILAVLRHLDTVSFNGTLKIAFSREEEIGCIGASFINEKWYKDVDLAIVVDRRGNRDIVVGCFSPFCSNEVGDFMENVSRVADMDWKCVEGGISDALIFSESGINSINISAGYMNEHTANEYVSLSAMKDSVTLLLQTFALINQFYHTFTEVPKTNKWVLDSYSYNYNSKNYDYNSGHNNDSKQGYYYEDYFEDDIWAEVTAVDGDCYVYQLGDRVIIHQDGNEISLTRYELNDMVNQFYGVRGAVEK